MEEGAQAIITSENIKVVNINPILKLSFTKAVNESIDFNFHKKLSLQVLPDFGEMGVSDGEPALSLPCQAFFFTTFPP